MNRTLKGALLSLKEAKATTDATCTLAGFPKNYHNQQHQIGVMALFPYLRTLQKNSCRNMKRVAP